MKDIVYYVLGAIKFLVLLGNKERREDTFVMIAL